MTHEEAKPIVAELMVRHLRLQVDDTAWFTAMDFKSMVVSLSAEDYAANREAIAAFDLKGP